MLEFEPHIKKMQEQQRKVATHRSRAETADKKLQTQLKTLIDACKPACTQVVEAYNETTAIKIIPESIGLSFDLDGRTYGIGARLVFSNGREPEEDISKNDVESIETALKLLLDAHFKKQGIPFTFRRLNVPYEYFCR